MNILGCFNSCKNRTLINNLFSNLIICIYIIFIFSLFSLFLRTGSTQRYKQALEFLNKRNKNNTNSIFPKECLSTYENTKLKNGLNLRNLKEYCEVNGKQVLKQAKNINFQSLFKNWKKIEVNINVIRLMITSLYLIFLMIIKYKYRTNPTAYRFLISTIFAINLSIVSFSFLILRIFIIKTNDQIGLYYKEETTYFIVFIEINYLIDIIIGLLSIISAYLSIKLRNNILGLPKYNVFNHSSHSSHIELIEQIPPEFQSLNDNNKSTEKYDSTCPLVNERKLINKKKCLNTIYGLDILNYKNNDFILIGFGNGKIEIYDSINLEIILQEEIINEFIKDISYLSDNYFIIIGDYLRIFIFYEDNSTEINKNSKKYKIQQVQVIKNEIINNNINLKYFRFSKAFIFDRNLYREFDVYEMEQDKKKKKINKSYKGVFSVGEELIVGTNIGIFVYGKKEEKENLLDLEIDDNSDKKEENNIFNIEELIEKWENNPFIFKEKITNLKNYDIVQVNFKYLAGTIRNYLCLYSMETYELITKFNVKISEDCDKISFMLTENILCVGGEDTISLISIKDFEIVLVSVIKTKCKITEICILPDFNILIGMRSNNRLEEYFHQYKYFCKLNKSTNKMEHCIIKGVSKFLTKNISNIRMRSLTNNRLVSIVDLNIIELWE